MAGPGEKDRPAPPSAGARYPFLPERADLPPSASHKTPPLTFPLFVFLFVSERKREERRGWGRWLWSQSEQKNKNKKNKTALAVAADESRPEKLRALEAIRDRVPSRLARKLHWTLVCTYTNVRARGGLSSPPSGKLTSAPLCRHEVPDSGKGRKRSDTLAP